MPTTTGDGTTCVPLDELRALSVCTEGGVWSANDWYEMFVDSIAITHVPSAWRERPRRAQVALSLIR